LHVAPHGRLDHLIAVSIQKTEFMRNERFHKKRLIFFTLRAELQVMPDALG